MDVTDWGVGCGLGNSVTGCGDGTDGDSVVDSVRGRVGVRNGCNGSSGCNGWLVMTGPLSTSIDSDLSNLVMPPASTTSTGWTCGGPMCHGSCCGPVIEMASDGVGQVIGTGVGGILGPVTATAGAPYVKMDDVNALVTDRS